MNHVEPLGASMGTARTGPPRITVGPAGHPDAPSSKAVDVTIEAGGRWVNVALTREQFAHLAASVLVPAELAAQFNGGRPAGAR